MGIVKSIVEEKEVQNGSKSNSRKERRIGIFLFVVFSRMLQFCSQRYHIKCVMETIENSKDIDNQDMASLGILDILQ